MAKKAKAPKKPAFPENLRAARKAAELSQEDAAHALGVKLLTWGRWERGETEPSFAKLEEIAELLGVWSGWLIDGRGDPKRQEGK
jgi:transcriptional regulator with XRE-family HTH domain